MIRRIHHHTLTVSDMDRSLRFYRDLLEFTVIYDKVREKLPAYDKVMNLEDVKVRVALLNDPTGEAIVALLQFYNPLPQKRMMSNLFVGSTALAVQTDAIDVDYQRLKAAGVRFTCEPVDVVRDGRVAARLAYAFDPDEIVVELYQPADAS
ncbi:MAG: VOC family protein [Planctomycetes bacterium]|nr:VOC family protein [Planctomycetota bacterium]